MLLKKNCIFTGTIFNQNRKTILIKRTHIVFCSLCVMLISFNMFSQSFSRANEWKRYRKEICVHIGASQFFGDLGGLNRTGTSFSPADIEFSLTRPAISVAYRYKILKNLNVHSGFNYLLVAGDDKLTSEIFRNNRNLNFKSNIFELSSRIELSFFRSKAGHRYGLKTALKGSKKRASELIGFIGIGAFYYNPKGLNPVIGEYVALRPLHTEGQGLPNGPKQYKALAISIPIGIAYRIILNKYWNFGFELNYRKTFTDYIDDVSTRYYNKAALQSAYGSNSVLMADPSLGKVTGATEPDARGIGAQRGDTEKDSYVSFQITVGRFFPPKRGKVTRLRSKF